MLFSKTIALSILMAMGAQGLIIDYQKLAKLPIEAQGNSRQEVLDFKALKLSDELAPLVRVKPSKHAKESLSDFEKKFKHHPKDKVSKHSKPHGKLQGKAFGKPIFGDFRKHMIVMKEGLSQQEFEFHKEWIGLQEFNIRNKFIAEHGKMVPVPFRGFRDHFAVEDVEYHQLDEHTLGFDINSLKMDIESFNIDGLFMGYSGLFTLETIELIRKNPFVKFIEVDSMVHSNEFDVQKGAPWGLARVSHRDPLSLATFNQYLYDNEGGEGVTAYVIDTGINVDHNEFGGRAIWGKTIPQNDYDEDDNGHGTHCAGTIASSRYGVAKKANVVAVKVLSSNGSGTMTDVVKGVEFAVSSHQAAVKEGKKGFKGSTANMSLGGGKSPALELAVNAAVNAGIHFGVAAGNENQDACNVSPAAAANPITVGATSISDDRADFSNWGKCVDIFGPGVNILSTYIGSTSAVATLSGTSMASPHIVGLLSYYVSLQPSSDSEFAIKGGLTPAQLKKNLIKYGTKGKLAGISGDTPNVLAFNGAGEKLDEFWSATEDVDQAAITRMSMEHVEKQMHELAKQSKCPKANRHRGHKQGRKVPFHGGESKPSIFAKLLSSIF